ncbi:hypothetical protein L596_017160 [Steinernema carpocapsae]|uniref:Uncharacterized protein n=1 Tax=Steinernema carpocapsae TaxID=34508 RepID=A0A4U5N104_STECR|nr:hypothetical protein L596_017160 [Steinernema carpocapsae]
MNTSSGTWIPNAPALRDVQPVPVTDLPANCPEQETPESDDGIKCFRVHNRRENTNSSLFSPRKSEIWQRFWA